MMTTPFQALQTAGLLSDDPTIVASFDMTGFVESPVRWASAARKAKPELFFDAMKATAVECDAWLRKLQQADVCARYDAINTRLMREYCARKGL